MEELLKRYPALSECKEDISAALDLIINTYKNKGKILVCGNGGSAAGNISAESDGCVIGVYK